MAAARLASALAAAGAATVDAFSGTLVHYAAPPFGGVIVPRPGPIAVGGEPSVAYTLTPGVPGGDAYTEVRPAIASVGAVTPRVEEVR